MPGDVSAVAAQDANLHRVSPRKSLCSRGLQGTSGRDPSMRFAFRSSAHHHRCATPPSCGPARGCSSAWGRDIARDRRDGSSKRCAGLTRRAARRAWFCLYWTHETPRSGARSPARHRRAGGGAGERLRGALRADDRRLGRLADRHARAVRRARRANARDLRADPDRTPARTTATAAPSAATSTCYPRQESRHVREQARRWSGKEVEVHGLGGAAARTRRRRQPMVYLQIWGYLAPPDEKAKRRVSPETTLEDLVTRAGEVRRQDRERARTVPRREPVRRPAVVEPRALVRLGAQGRRVRRLGDRQEAQGRGLEPRRQPEARHRAMAAGGGARARAQTASSRSRRSR